jgi:hypothetical protein
MDAWGGKLLAAATGVAEMAALGWGLDADAFTSRMQGERVESLGGSGGGGGGSSCRGVPNVLCCWLGRCVALTRECAACSALSHAPPSRSPGGPHLLAPTGSDLQKHGGLVGTVLAGFHYDLNFITVSGSGLCRGLGLAVLACVWHPG